MADALSMAVAAAVAGKAAESMTGQAQQTVAAMVRKIRDKFGKHSPTEIATLDAAIRDESAAEPLARVLDRVFAADPAFRDDIRALWLQAAPAATGDGVSNVFYGKAEKVIQVRDIHGGMTIN